MHWFVGLETKGVSIVISELHCTWLVSRPVSDFVMFLVYCLPLERKKQIYNGAKEVSVALLTVSN